MAEQARNNNGLPAWAKTISVLIGQIGLTGFIALYLLGAFDAFMPSPVTAALRKHDEQTARVLRTICRGVWQGHEMQQSECDR